MDTFENTRIATLPFAGGTLSRHRLQNGLTVLLLPDRSAPVVSYHTWFRVGSRHERPGKTGLAHLFEHLMFNETASLKAGEFDRKLEEVGAESNAATWVDWTYYYESLPKDYLSLAIRLEASRMSELVLRAPQVASEKDVVANERRYRVEDDVDGAASELLYRTVFERHPYGWPTIGWMEDIQSFTPEDCERFYRAYYAPANATLVVAGDIQVRAVMNKIIAAYGAIPSAELPLEDSEPEPPQTQERRVSLEKPVSAAKVYLGYRGPAFGDDDHVALSVLSEVLFAGRASVGHARIVQEKELAIEVRAWVSTFRDPGIFELSATARTGVEPETLIGELTRILEEAKVIPPSESDLARAKARLELALVQSLETASGKAEQIGYYETMLDDPLGAFRRLAAYQRVSLNDLRRVARRYFVQGARTVLTVLPSGEAEDPDAAEAGEAGDASAVNA
jgi:zinc protease